MRFDQSPSDGSGNDKFLKLKDGENVKVILRGEPYCFRTKWHEGKSSVVPEGTEGASFRFRINVVISDKGIHSARIWEQGARVYKQLKELSQEYNLEETVLKISRTGSTKDDTTYTVIPMPGKVADKTLSEIRAIQLFELEHNKPAGGDPFNDGFDFAKDDPGF